MVPPCRSKVENSMTDFLSASWTGEIATGTEIVRAPVKQRANLNDPWISFRAIVLTELV